MHLFYFYSFPTLFAFADLEHVIVRATVGQVWTSGKSHGREFKDGDFCERMASIMLRICLVLLDAGVKREREYT